jgi:hypothetical protein
MAIIFLNLLWCVELWRLLGWFTETIIVGISQNKKNEENDCNYERRWWRSFWKGANFSIYWSELLPYIEKKYRIAPIRIIAGHDVTAGFQTFSVQRQSYI